MQEDKSGVVIFKFITTRLSSCKIIFGGYCLYKSADWFLLFSVLFRFFRLYSCFLESIVRILTFADRWCARGYRLFARGYRLLARGYRLLARGYRWCARGYRLCARGYRWCASAMRWCARGYRLCARGYRWCARVMRWWFLGIGYVGCLFEGVREWGGFDFFFFFCLKTKETKFKKRWSGWFTFLRFGFR